MDFNMSKLRSVSTAIWSDPFIEELTPAQKLLFIYLITNEKTNMLGVYELSIRKISFETGIDKPTIEKALKEFEKLKKVRYENNHVVLLNYLKHQHFNTNMKKSAIEVYENLPNFLKFKELNLDKSNPSKAFETLCKAFGMVRKVEVEVEVEYELEVEEEIETKEIVFPFTSENFIYQWQIWKQYKKEQHKFTYKSEASEQAALTQLQKMATNRELKAIEIIHHTMANGWKGFVEPKTDPRKETQEAFQAVKDKINFDFSDGKLSFER